MPNPLSTFEIGRNAQRAYCREELMQALRLVRNADIAMKSSWKDSRILLEILVWQIITGRGPDSEPLFDLQAQAELGTG